jgi:hypothetical protein
MKPKAIRNPAMVRGTDGLLRFEMVDAGREFVLDPLAELVWDLSDGSRDLEALAQAAGRAFDRVVHREEVFSALDFLADAGLIEERVAPPVAEGNVSRRSLLVRIGPIAGAAAWMMSGVSARAGGLLQYNESASKESDNKARDREYNDKESGRKATARESDNKERDNKEGDNKAVGKRDWDRQQDAEKGRKSEFKRTFDQVNESARKREIRDEQVEQKIRASWPKVYGIVGHKLSEFPELQQCWGDARNMAGWNGWNHPLTADNYSKAFEDMQPAFGTLIRVTPAARDRFAKAGFDLPGGLLPRVLPGGLVLIDPPLLAGDSDKKTYLILEHIADPAIGDNWQYALSADNLRFAFDDVEAAYQFLSNRRATGAQTKK